MKTKTFDATKITSENVDDYKVVRCEHKQKPVLSYSKWDNTHLHNDDLPETEGMLETEVEITERKDAEVFLLRMFMIKYGLIFSSNVMVLTEGTKEINSLDRAIEIYLSCIEDDRYCEIQECDQDFEGRKTLLIFN